MRLTPMRFKNYTWPYNPETYAVEFERRVAAHKAPFGRYVLQDLGVTARVLRGEGTFVGEGAYDAFTRLAAVFEEPGPGLLVHPVWPASRAYFVSLQVTETPLPDYVRYRFEFWEAGGAENEGMSASAVHTGGEAPTKVSAESTTYIVKKGDTLWGIAQRCGVTLAALLTANPGIKNPNLIYPGDRVKIP